jgi:hypothetical protein
MWWHSVMLSYTPDRFFAPAISKLRRTRFLAPHEPLQPGTFWPLLPGHPPRGQPRGSRQSTIPAMHTAGHPARAKSKPPPTLTDSHSRSRDQGCPLGRLQGDAGTDCAAGDKGCPSQALCSEQRTGAPCARYAGNRTAFETSFVSSQVKTGRLTTPLSANGCPGLRSVLVLLKYCTRFYMICQIEIMLKCVPDRAEIDIHGSFSYHLGHAASNPGSCRLRRLDHPQVGEEVVPGQREPSPTLCWPLAGRRDQLLVLPAAQAGHLCTMGSLGARHLPLCGQGAAYHHP